MKAPNTKENKLDYEYQERLYITSLLEANIALFPNQIGQNKTKDNLRNMLASYFEGKCIHEGYVQPNSITIKSYTCGIVKEKKSISL